MKFCNDKKLTGMSLIFMALALAFAFNGEELIGIAAIIIAGQEQD